MLIRVSKARFSLRNRRLLHEKQAALSLGSSRSPPHLFTAAELEDATAGYHPSHLIKHDDNYELYRATVGGQAVSVKRATPEVVANCRGKGGGGVDHLVEGLLTEIVVLSGVGHRNVVKLLGCCLETQVPAIVYDLHSHRTLQDGAFAPAGPPRDPMTWPSRLRAATEVAGGLHYLHRHAPLTIVHRDLKPSSVLLDEHGIPKIVDFSLSIPIPPNRTEAVTDVIAGTAYYIDPETFLTGVVTEKSDVYAFGMLLVVLMLGKHPGEWEEEKGYPFRSRLGSGEGEIGGLVGREELVGSAGGLGEAEGKVEQLWAFADLAFECLRRKGEERPTMKEVERRLREISSLMP